MDGAYGLALRVIDRAAQTVDGQQVDWLVQVANRLAATHEPAKAAALSATVGTRTGTADRERAAADPGNAYVRFDGQPARAGEMAAAIDEYRRVLTDANGPESGSMAEPLRLRMEMERGHGQWEKAEASARELLELQEWLSGSTSETYLGELQNLARLYEAAGDTAHAVVLLAVQAPMDAIRKLLEEGSQR